MRADTRATMSLTYAFAASLACAIPPAKTSTPAPEPAPASEPERGALIRIDDNLYGRYFQAKTAPEIGQQAPRFSLATADGGTVELEGLLAQGKPVVIVFYRGFW